MDGLNNISPLVARPSELEGRGSDDESRLKQLAKDFETVLLTKLVDEMKETVGDWGLEEEDVGAGQMQGLFWMYLAQDLGDKGGLGLWKDLHRFFTDMKSPAEPPASESMDEVL